MSKPILEAAAFLDSDQARGLSLDRAEIQDITQRFLHCVFEDAGVTPRLLDGEDLNTILSRLLPARFGHNDPLARHVEAVLEAYLESLDQREVVPHALKRVRELFGPRGLELRFGPNKTQVWLRNVRISSAPEKP